MKKTISIPCTKYKLQVQTMVGGFTCNGNGYKNKTISFTITTMVGNGDCGDRCCTGDPKNFASVNGEIKK